MLGYEVVEWTHIVSAAVLFLTGLGTAVSMWLAHRGGNVRAIASTARKIVRVDVACTIPSLLVLPTTGAILAWMVGLSPGAPWLVASDLLYAITCVCWAFATSLWVRVRDTAVGAASRGESLPDVYYRYMRWWFQLSWPAFIALLVVFYLMVAQPQAGTIGATGIPAL